MQSGTQELQPNPLELIDELVAIVGAENVLIAAEDIVPYSFDGTAALRQRPVCVVFPRDTRHVSKCLRIARRRRVPIVTRGYGTGLSGGSVPIAGCVVLCTSHLNRILEIDPANRTLRAEAGAITQNVDKRAGEFGLFYLPNPGSQKISTIGGNVAENVAVHGGLGSRDGGAWLLK
jgi:glycolate oxidase